ncbi:hypothetical protein BDZ94DRAFT_968545 [Collybia nuda]|uniref:F-box domain-containing protein n=1 Tax=Collybia nuda TaxID=64659 RepID=A0A9P5YGU3_9AGAR|nr:hypothetical protein BDZ94DRAFT_968545 [Collybia nuda]
MALDLPVELWLHILELLPKHYLRKMMGINRTLFELATNDMYQEIRFIDDGKEMVRIFDQLKYPHISRRVRHLYIRPGFFSRMDSVNLVQVKPKERPRGNGWKKLLCFSVDILTKSSRRKKYLGSRERDILAVAQDTLVHFQRVEELSIVLYDLLPPPTFPNFVREIWINLGPKLHRLNIDATLVKLPLIFDPNMAHHLPNLMELDIRLSVSRFPYVPQRTSLVRQTILPFILSLKGTLESLSLSSAEISDLSPLFHGLGYFPHLRKLDLRVVMNCLTLSDPAALTSFITLHKDNLQELSMRAHHHTPLNNPSDVSYETWITKTLPQIKFPALVSLTVGLHAGYHSSRTIIPQLSSKKLPSLVFVTLKDAPLSHDDVKTVLEHAGEFLPWQTLRLNLTQLTPLLIDTLAAGLPHLAELDMTCGQVSADLDPSPYFSRPHLFKQEMDSRTYPGWSLRRLRIAVISYECGQPHVDLNYMSYVAHCLPLAVSFLVDDSCFCKVVG